MLGMHGCVQLIPTGQKKTQMFVTECLSRSFDSMTETQDLLHNECVIQVLSQSTLNV